MAMDLFCYSSKSQSEVCKILDLIKEENKDLFSKKFLISNAREAGSIQKEIAIDYGLNARSIFLIRYNEKTAADMSPAVVDIIKVALGVDDVVILFENEKLR